MTTQYLEEADRLADDIVVVDHGQIIAQGDARSLKRQVGGDQIQVVASRADQLDAVVVILARASAGEPAVDASSRSVTAPTSDGVSALAAVASALHAEGIEVDDLGLRQPTLDEVFLTLTGTPAHDDENDENPEAPR